MKKSFDKKQKEKGYVRVTVYVPEYKKADLVKLAAKWREMFKQSLREKETQS